MKTRRIPGRIDSMGRFRWHTAVRSAMVTASFWGLAAACPAAVGDEFQTVAFASFAGGNELAADLEALGALLQTPSLPDVLGRAVARRSGVATWEGLDPERKWGAAIGTDGVRLAPMLYIPVTDVETLLASLEPLIGAAESQPHQADPVWKIGRGAVTGYVSQRQGWAYVVQTQDLFAHCLSPEHLEQAFASLPKGHDLAVRFFPTRLPEALRTWGVDMLREQSAALGDEPQANGNTPQAARRRLNALGYRLLESSLIGQRQVTWSFRFDRGAKQAQLDLEILPEPASALAKQLKTTKIPQQRPLPAQQDGAIVPAGQNVELALANRIAAIVGDTCLLSFGPRGEALLEQAMTIDKDRSSDGDAATVVTVHAGALASSLGKSLTDGRQAFLLQVIGASLQTADDRLVLSIETANDRLQAKLALHEGIMRGAAAGLNMVMLQSDSGER